MFGFLDMIGNYESRKVANDEVNGAIIDTCRVTDSDQPYETGIQSPDYNNGEWVIVEMYESEALASIGHNKWVETFKTSKPKELKDVSTSELKKLIDALQ